MNEKLIQLGRRLKEVRIDRNDTQKEFACRIGISIPTLYKMEQGDPSVAIGHWVNALSVLDRINELDNLIAPQKSLFDRYHAQEKIKKRYRVRREK